MHANPNAHCALRWHDCPRWRVSTEQLPSSKHTQHSQAERIEQA
jgi:hypothetical protein